MRGGSEKVTSLLLFGALLQFILAAVTAVDIYALWGGWARGAMLKGKDWNGLINGVPCPYQRSGAL